MILAGFLVGWLATASDVVGLRVALARGALVDERHEGWTPRMCAAKGHRAGVDALAVLVESGGRAATGERG